jgi:NTE family protein
VFSFGFKLVKMNNNIYLDEGILNNLLVEQIINKCEFIIRVHANTMDIKAENLKIKNMLDRRFYLLMSKTVYYKLHLCNLFI